MLLALVLSNDIKSKSIRQFLTANKFDIIFLQEAHLSPNKLKLREMEWGSKIIWNHGTTNSKGVAIGFERNLKDFCFKYFSRQRW